MGHRICNTASLPHIDVGSSALSCSGRGGSDFSISSSCRSKLPRRPVCVLQHPKISQKVHVHLRDQLTTAWTSTRSALALVCSCNNGQTTHKSAGQRVRVRELQRHGDVAAGRAAGRHAVRRGRLRGEHVLVERLRLVHEHEHGGGVQALRRLTLFLYSAGDRAVRTESCACTGW